MLPSSIQNEDRTKAWVRADEEGSSGFDVRYSLLLDLFIKLNLISDSQIKVQTLDSYILPSQLFVFTYLDSD